METNEAETPAERLARYTPTALPAAQWELARDGVIAAVLSAGPENAEDAKGLVSRLCQLLAAHPGWDRRHAPSLPVLVTEAAIAMHLERLKAAGKSGKTRENHRADLRRIARGLAGTVTAARPAAPARAVPRASGPLLAWLLACEPVPVAVRAWEELTGRSVTRDVLNPVVTAVKGANASGLDAGTVAALSRVGTPAWGEASPPTWPPHVPEEIAYTAASKAPPTRSRAAVLRAAKTALAAQAAPTVAPAPDLSLLAAPVQEAITSYRPTTLTDARWAELRPLCRRLMTGYAPPSPTAARSTGTVLVAFLDWAAQRPGRVNRSTPLTAEELQTSGLVEAYLAQLTAPDASVATYRSVLRRAVRALDPDPAATIAYQPVAGPYSAAECAALVRLARNQPTGPRRRELCVIVGLGLGAGLDGRDLRGVLPSDVTDVELPDGTSGLLVAVRGDRPRTVPVRQAYAPLVQEALALHAAERRGRQKPLLGVKQGRRNITNPALARAVTATDTGVDIAVNRLRATWLVACLSAGVPLGGLLQAAGLRSARTLTDLLPYCPAPDTDAVTALLLHLPPVPAPVASAGGQS